MQLFALDEFEQAIFARDGVKKQNYRCPECLSTVRVRKGDVREPHFYHLNEARKCFLNHKTLEHIQAQLKIYSLIPEGEGKIECPFPSIGRIADVAWTKKNLVFEVQRSPITLKEVLERIEDYKKVGFKTIWILNDRKYNKKRLCGAEAFLREHRCYFTNIDEKGSGFFYDQFETRNKSKRIRKGKPLPVNLSTPLFPKQTIDPHTLPQGVARRMDEGVYFKGDILDRFIHNPKIFSDNVGVWKEPPLKRAQKALTSIPSIIARLYRHSLQSAIESFSS